MTTNDYQLLADCIAKAHATIDACYNYREVGHAALQVERALLCEALKRDNPRFKKNRFSAACDAWKDNLDDS